MGILGIVVFALGITASIALHEAGHMFTARAFGMRVRRYFIGFGPTLWSMKRGNTEYGVAALPFGGFCDIAGMTAQDPVTAEEAPVAMYRKPWWQRVAVLSGGIAMNILIGICISYFVAIFAAIPNPYADRTPTIGELQCASDQLDAETLAHCSGRGPAYEAGLREGDRVLALDGQAVETFPDIREYVLARPGETVEFEVDRGGQDMLFDVPVATVKRIHPATGEFVDAGAVGVASAPVVDAMRSFGPIEAMPATLRFTGQMLQATVEGLIAFPGKIPGVVASIFGAERDIEGPVSVIGASRVGGELVAQNMWAMFWMMLASLNFFLALFNLLPLPPLDGGHIAVVLYEKVRDAFRRMRGLAPAGPADYTRLMPVTYAMAAALLTVGVFVMLADVVNPIKLFG